MHSRCQGVYDYNCVQDLTSIGLVIDVSTTKLGPQFAEIEKKMMMKAE